MLCQVSIILTQGRLASTSENLHSFFYNLCTAGILYLFPNWSYGIYVNVESVLFVNNKCWEEVANISLAGEDDGRFAFTWQFPQCRWASTTYPQTHEPQVERKMPLSGDPCRDVHPPIHDDANDRAPPQIVVIRIIMARSSR